MGRLCSEWHQLEDRMPTSRTPPGKEPRACPTDEGKHTTPLARSQLLWGPPGPKSKSDSCAPDVLQFLAFSHAGLQFPSSWWWVMATLSKVRRLIQPRVYTAMAQDRGGRGVTGLHFPKPSLLVITTPGGGLGGRRSGCVVVESYHRGALESFASSNACLYPGSNALCLIGDGEGGLDGTEPESRRFMARKLVHTHPSS
jgi:hypothetical protein